ncbi:MAG: hypothetical protein LBI48_05060 [Burkholderiaceae bacterium]|nr:hypothetical protein [Burkholderiaceae bacterium]
MKAHEFEKRVWAVEGVHIVFCIDADKEIGEYTYTKELPTKHMAGHVTNREAHFKKRQ